MASQDDKKSGLKVEDAIKAANPAFDVFMNKAEVLAMAEDARRMPSRLLPDPSVAGRRYSCVNTSAGTRPRKRSRISSSRPVGRPEDASSELEKYELVRA